MTTEDTSGPSKVQESNAIPTEASLSSQRVFKKSSPNNKLTLYLSSRDLVVSSGKIDKITGVLLVDPEFVENKKVFGQVTLTFRYGREDEEVMGLKFSNEAIMCLSQLYPPPLMDEGNDRGVEEFNTPLQEALLKRLGPHAYPFTMEITPLAPPSVQLVPAKEYNGAPIGTSYDVRAYVAERFDEKLHRRAQVRMGIRVVQRAFAPPSPHMYNPASGRTSKERAKLNRKALLHGCKSAPLVERFNDEQYKSRSVETVGTIHHHESGKFCKIEDTSVHILTPKIENYPTNKGSPSVSIQSELKVTESNNQRNSSETMECTGKEISEKSPSHATKENENDDESKNLQRQDSLQDNSDDAETETQMDHYRSLCGSKRPSLAVYLAGVPPPRAAIEKPFLLSDGRISLTASLDKAIYSHGEDIAVTVQITNNTGKTVRRIKIFVVQHVDVCMFSNGKFKNVVAMVNDKADCPITSGGSLVKTFTLLPLKSATKNWIALEDSYTKSGTSLASTVTSSALGPDERNVFAIYVSYYVKVKLLVSVMGGAVSLKLPFTLMHTCSEFEHTETLTKIQKTSEEINKINTQQQESSQEIIRSEKDGT